MDSDGSALKVIIADDSALVRERMASLLGEISGVEVSAETSDVPGTIDCVRRLMPHVLLLDISMPGGCGLDVLAWIRAERIPTLVVVVTNNSDPEYEIKARQNGAVEFFDKSRDFQKAADFIRELSERIFSLRGESSFPWSPANSISQPN